MSQPPIPRPLWGETCFSCGSGMEQIPICQCSNLNCSTRFPWKETYLKAEIEMLRGVGCNEDGDGPCGACLRCYKVRAEKAEKLLADMRTCARCNHDIAGHSHHTYLKGSEELEPNRCSCCHDCPQFIPKADAILYGEIK